MNEFLPLLLDLSIGCVAGLALGAIFFGGLWWTMQRLVKSSHPALLAALSFVGRLGVLGFGLFLLAQVGAVALIAATSGIIAIRQWMTNQARCKIEGAA